MTLNMQDRAGFCKIWNLVIYVCMVAQVSGHALAHIRIGYPVWKSGRASEQATLSGALGAHPSKFPCPGLWAHI